MRQTYPGYWYKIKVYGDNVLAENINIQETIEDCKWVQVIKSAIKKNL